MGDAEEQSVEEGRTQIDDDVVMHGFETTVIFPATHKVRQNYHTL